MGSANRLRSFGIAALLAIALLAICRQITLHGWYAAHPYYRAQTDALMSGRFALSKTPDGLFHDLAWTQSGVEQVWGLGVALWQLPFEALGRLVGIAPFPDRIALAAWLALMFYAVIRAFEPRDLESRWMQIGAVVIVALLPGVVTMLRCRLGVYEEADVYAYGAAVMLLAGVLAFARAPTGRQFAGLATFAGLTGLIRPTVWFYGLAAVIVMSAIYARRERRRTQVIAMIALGGALFAVGGAALYATNAARFGRGTEFGHRLNVEALPGNIVATRFSYPFERVGVVAATEELVGSMFGRPELRYQPAAANKFYQRDLHVGQADEPRWREYYFTTYSWPYLPLILAGGLLGVLAWLRRDGDRVARVLSAWAVLGALPLFAFYLHSPSLTSRYQLDFAPAIAALLVILWRAVALHRPRGGFAVLAAGWALAIVTSKITRPGKLSAPLGRAVAAERTYAVSRPTAHEHPLPNHYDRFELATARLIDDGEPSFALCSDADGARISCDAPPVAGDIVVTATRVERRFEFVREQIAGEPDEPTECWSDPPTCALGPTVRTDPRLAVVDRFASEPLLYGNGFGWDHDTGAVPPATLFYLRDPAYVELEVEGPASTNWNAVRVAVELEHLRLVAAADTAHGARLRFAVAQRHPGLVVAFIAFGPDTELDRPVSQFALRSIRWRDD